MRAITDAAIRAAIRAARTARKPVTLKDPGPRGAGRLSLQVRPGTGGTVTAEWYAIFYRGGRRMQAKIGSYPGTTLAAARDAFSRDYGPAISSGRDPRAAIREALRKRATAGTVKDLFRAYVDHLKETGRKSWPEYERALLTMSYAAAGTLGEDRAAADITAADIVALLGEIYRRGARSHADHMRSYLHAAFNWGLRADSDYRQSSRSVRWGLTSNPVAAVPRDTHANRVGERHLSPDELRDFWGWLAERKDHAARVLQLQIATGQRVQMLAAIGPRHFDSRQRLLTWQGDETKNGRPHVLPLPGKALDILRRLPKVDGQALYFPQRRNPEKPVTHFTVSDLCREYCGRDEFDGEPFTPRDVRRTWKTLAGMAGVDKEMRDRLQHHAMRDVGSMHYDRYDYLPEKRAAMKVWSDWLDRTLAGAGGVALLRNSARQ